MNLAPIAALSLPLRPFTKEDWYGFAGASDFIHGGGEPLIGEGRFADGMTFVLVLDGTGGCLVADDAEADFGGYQLLREFGTAAEAHAWAQLRLAGLSRLDQFIAAGFTAQPG